MGAQMLHIPFSWTDRNHAIAVDMWAKGSSTTEIADCIGTSRNSISGHMSRNRKDFPKKKQGLSDRQYSKTPWTEERIAKVEKMWREDMLVKDIAKAVGASPKSISWLAGQDRARFPLRNFHANQKRGEERAVKNRANYNRERINAGLPPLPKSNINLDYSRFRIDGIPTVSLFDVKDGQCRFPVCDETLSGADLALCGATATSGLYCTIHSERLHGEGTRSEQHAIDGMGGRRL